jgi:glucose/arabinose dehydrogenase
MRSLSLLFLLVASCSAGGASGSAQQATRSDLDTTGAASPATPLDRAPFAVQEVARFDSPWAMAFLPGGSALVTEAGGTLKLRQPDGHVIDVTGVPQVTTSPQGGLLDVALSPAFANDNVVYLSYSEAGPGGDGLALARAKLVRNGGAARLDGLQVIWRDPAKGRGGQFGAIILFSPDGKFLYLTSGERQRFTPAQDPSQPLGKILRLTPDGKPAPGNPFASKTGAQTVVVTDPPRDTEVAKSVGGRQVTLAGPNLTPAETWSSGHRNPYGLAFTPDGRLWETEMGPRGGDELNLILPGKNYGWPVVSEGTNYDRVPIPHHASHPEFQPPKLFWVPSISPSSLMIYSGNLFREWKGSGFIGALSGQALIRVTFDGASAHKADQWDMGTRIRFVTQGPDGAVYLLEDGSPGRLLRLAPKR